MAKINLTISNREFVVMFVECSEMATEETNSLRIDNFDQYIEIYTAILAGKVMTELCERTDSVSIPYCGKRMLS